ncbi:MAG: imidazolonepropionase [Candidatus Riflebacteria bacterium HGW-Riflebacteria-1]|jgi:imidazolonepropionase|nr:MAG: imidazolonepropionase [Candidatus Riflebacteria bacterium HGW-Riflebacteria-1]
MSESSRIKADFIVHNLASAVLFPEPYRGQGTVPSWRTEELKNASVAAKEGVIVWVGPSARLSAEVQIEADARFYNGCGMTAVPGFVDSHTHLVYAGDRSDEFEMRVQGRSYLDILAAGGGILRTTEAIRNMPEELILVETLDRIEQIMRTGVTTVEIKTGYGLDLENELKMLRVIDRLKEESLIRIIPTFMGAHAIPADRRSDPDAFVDEICKVWIPEVARLELAMFNDVFTENKAFSVQQSRRILEAGLANGLRAKIHADEVNVLGGVDLAVELGAVSADHLLMTGDAGIAKLKGSGVIPTVLPGTSTYLMESHHAPARKMIEACLPLAIASDHNPGSCQFLGATIIQALAMLQLRLSASEALIAGTLHAAHALGFGDQIGAIEPGRRMDLALFAGDSFRQIGYQAGASRVEALIVGGVVAIDQF